MIFCELVQFFLNLLKNETIFNFLPYLWLQKKMDNKFFSPPHLLLLLDSGFEILDPGKIKISILEPEKTFRKLLQSRFASPISTLANVSDPEVHSVYV